MSCFLPYFPPPFSFLLELTNHHADEQSHFYPPPLSAFFSPFYWTTGGEKGHAYAATKNMRHRSDINIFIS
jgi:hypothetical protein